MFLPRKVEELADNAVEQIDDFVFFISRIYATTSAT